VSIFSGRRFPKDVILWAVRWYCRYGVSYRDLEEMLTERGVPVDHTTVYRWVQRYAPELDKQTRWYRRVGEWTAQSWRVDETYIRIGGKWCYLYRAVTSHGDTLNFYLSTRRNTASAKRFLAKTLRSTAHAGPPRVINTDKNPALAAAIAELKADGQCAAPGGEVPQQPDRRRSRPVEEDPGPEVRVQDPGNCLPDAQGNRGDARTAQRLGQDLRLRTLEPGRGDRRESIRPRLRTAGSSR
jgi:IS6 family transposase